MRGEVAAAHTKELRFLANCFDLNITSKQINDLNIYKYYGKLVNPMI